MHSAFQPRAINDNFNLVAVAHLADGPAGKRLGRDVANAGAGRNAAETRIGQHGYVLAVRQLLQRRGDLVNLLHARARWPAANKHHDVALRNLAGLDGLNRRGFGDEDPRWAGVTINIVLADQRGIDRGALDDRPLRREVAERKTNGGSKSTRARAITRHEHVIGINAVDFLQSLAQRRAARAFPPP